MIVHWHIAMSSHNFLMGVDLVVLVVFTRLLRHHVIEREVFHDVRRGLADSAAKRSFIHVGVLVLDVLRHKLLSDSFELAVALFLVAVLDILPSDFVAGCFEQLLLDLVLKKVDVDRVG